MDISLQWISIWISLDFYGYPCIDLVWILDPGLATIVRCLVHRSAQLASEGRKQRYRRSNLKKIHGRVFGSESVWLEKGWFCLRWLTPSLSDQFCGFKGESLASWWVAFSRRFSVYLCDEIQNWPICNFRHNHELSAYLKINYHGASKKWLSLLHP